MTEEKPRRRRVHPLFDYTYEDDITYECPVRGKVTQKVLVKRYKSKVQAAREAEVLKNNDDIEDLLDEGFHVDEEGYEEVEE